MSHKSTLHLLGIMMAALIAAAAAGRASRPAQATDSLRRAIDAWVAIWNSHDLNGVSWTAYVTYRHFYHGTRQESGEAWEEIAREFRAVGDWGGGSLFVRGRGPGNLQPLPRLAPAT